MTDLVIPDDITTIKEYTFAYCKSLTSVKISNSVTSIERHAFEGCSNLTSVTIGENVANIESDAFYGCTSLKYLHIENGTEMLCLSQNENLTNKVGKGLFFDCPLETLYIGRNLDYNTSSNCGYSPFYNKKTLKSVIIGNSVTSIKTNAFKNCDMITGIYLLGTTPPAVGNNNFTNSQYMNLTIYVPQGTLDAYQNANVWKNFWNIYEEGTTETPDVEVKKCATPVIIYNNSGFDITSETDGAEIHTKITCSDVGSYNDSRIDLSATYNITTYATKSGYLNSETATATFCWVPVNGESEETNIIKVEALPVLITSNNGTLKISGGKEGAEVVVYNINGVAIGNATITNGSATISTSLVKGEIAIVNIAGKGIKVVMQ